MVKRVSGNGSTLLCAADGIKPGGGDCHKIDPGPTVASGPVRMLGALSEYVGWGKGAGG